MLIRVIQSAALAIIRGFLKGGYHPPVRIKIN